MTHSKAPWLTRGSAIALMMAAAIALAACGGGGGLNEDESATLEERLDTAEANAAAALVAQQAEEAARIAAEAAQATAEAEKATAEAEKAVADAAREVAVADAAAAEMAKATAEAETATAEAARELAVAAREVAVAEAAAAETDRLAAEAEKATADAARELAVAAKKTAEADAAAARAATKTAEDEAAAARTDQQAAEKARDAAKVAQTLAEENADAQVALAVTANMAAQVAADAAEQAKAALTVARDMQKQAEVDRDAAIAAEAEAQRLLGLAQAARTDEVQRRQEAERQAEQQQEQLQQQLTEAEQAALNARALSYIAAIHDGGGAMTRSGVTVTYMRGSTLKINPGGNFETGSGAPAISGFTPRTYTREVGVSGEQTLYHYTNIQAPGTRAFWKIHGLEVEAAAATALNVNTANNPTPTGTPRVVRAGDAPLDYETAATYDIAVSGTYDGVSGTYTCAGSTCTISDGLDEGAEVTAADFNASAFATLSGQREFVIGSWSFKPGSINSGVRQDQDTEYLYFGIWVEEPNLASGMHDYEFITGGSSPFTAVPELSGTAKFRGGAVGKYVTRDQVGDNAKIGTFTAAANFTAVFGNTPTLEGRITDFRNGSEALTGWSVYLGGENNQPAVFASGALTDENASARVGGVSATGTWDATLYGTPNPGRADLADEDDAATKYPLARYPKADLAGLVGNFHATNNEMAADATAALAGAFAATPQ